MDKTKVAAIWFRVSTHDQRELSLDAQEEEVQRVLANSGFETPAQYVLKVDWTSLDLMACPQFQLLIRWIASGEVGALGVVNRDRLQAQGPQRLVFLFECRERGVEVITSYGVPMLEGTEGQLVELALALGKERSVVRAQQGARAGLRARALLKGLPPNYQAPLGRRWENDRLVPGTSYHVACEIWRMALEGETQWGIAKELTRRGLPTPRGGRVWSGTTIGSILSNRVYAGVVEALKTEAVAPKKRLKATYGNTSTRRRPEEERVRLEGLVAAPIVTEEEFEWVQDRRRHNQRFASKNTRLREYLLKGRIRCVLCGRVYTGVTRGNQSYYYCRGRAKVDWGADKCSAEKLRAQEVERAVYNIVVHVLESPEVYLGEVERRWQILEQTRLSLRRELDDLDKQERAEREAEAQALRLASRFEVSEDAFQQEVGLIRARRRWIGEERERVQSRLNDLGDGPPDPKALGMLAGRLKERLSSATCQDQRFILDALGATIIAQGDGTWELELEIPPDPSADTPEVQIVNERPRSGWG